MTPSHWPAGAVLVLAMTTAAAAQEPLTLERALADSLDRNASLAAARAGSRVAAAEVAVARSALFPRVSLSESWQRSNQPVFVFSSLLAARRFAAANFTLDALNHPTASGFYQASIAIDQIVFDGGMRRSAAAAAAVRQEMADAETSAAIAQLAMSVTTTFGRVIAAQAIGRAARAALESAREDLARAERRRDAGMATDADVLALVVHVADLEQERIAADGDAAIARAELNRLRGVAVDGDFVAVEPPPPSTGETAPADLAALLTEADRARPELRRAAAADRLAELGRRQARAALIPQLAAQAGVDHSGVEWSARARSWSIGGELRWTLSTGGSEIAQVRAAAEGAARQRAQHEDIRAAVHVDVVTAVRRRDAAQARNAAGRAAVAQARESQRITRDRFDAGLASVNDVLRAATAVLDAEANATAALVDTLVSDAMLSRALGRLP